MEDFHEKVRRMKEVQQWCWVYAGTRVEKNQEGYNRVPVEKLEFVPYEVGDFFYTRVVPKRVPKSKKAEERIILSAKLQFRYAGPYVIKEKLSPIVYRAIIHNKERVVHALNMKPANKKRKFIKRVINLKRRIATDGDKKRYKNVQNTVQKEAKESDEESEEWVDEEDDGTEGNDEANGNDEGGEEHE